MEVTPNVGKEQRADFFLIAAIDVNMSTSSTVNAVAAVSYSYIARTTNIIATTTTSAFIGELVTAGAASSDGLPCRGLYRLRSNHSRNIHKL